MGLGPGGAGNGPPPRAAPMAAPRLPDPSEGPEPTGSPTRPGPARLTCVPASSRSQSPLTPTRRRHQASREAPRAAMPSARPSRREQSLRQRRRSRETKESGAAAQHPTGRLIEPGAREEAARAP